MSPWSADVRIDCSAYERADAVRAGQQLSELVERMVKEPEVIVVGDQESSARSRILCPF